MCKELTAFTMRDTRKTTFIATFQKQGET